MPHGCRVGRQPLTWEELRKLPDRAPVYLNMGKGNEHSDSTGA